jgi:hypothetical protein
VLRSSVAVRVAISRHFSRAVSVSGGRPCKNTPESINAPKREKISRESKKESGKP